MADKRNWKPMDTCPREGLVILKSHVEGGYWPVIARYSQVHGGFVIPPVLGQQETLVLAAEAWAEIPAYDSGVHSREAA